MTTIFTTQSGELEFSVIEEEQWVVIQAVHKSSGREWRDQFVERNFWKERAGSFKLNRENILPILQRTYKIDRFRLVMMEFPTNIVVSNEQACDKIRINFLLVSYNDVYTFDIVLKPVSDPQQKGKYLGEIMENASIGAEGNAKELENMNAVTEDNEKELENARIGAESNAKVLDHIKSSAKDEIKELMCLIKGLENKVTLLQASHDEEQKKASELENKLADYGIMLTTTTAVNKFFVIDKNSNGLISSIVPNNENIGIQTSRFVSFLANDLDSFLSHKKCEELGVLSLKNIGCDKLPANIFSRCSLEWLDVSCNPICVLPNEVSNLCNLKMLLLSGCGLKELPQTFGKLDQLEFLNISCNKFVSIPDCVYELSKLETLNIENNLITFIPNDIKKLVNLKEFFVCGCPITFVSDHIKALDKLALFEVKYVDPHAIATSIVCYKGLVNAIKICFVLVGIAFLSILLKSK